MALTRDSVLMGVRDRSRSQAATTIVATHSLALMRGVRRAGPLQSFGLRVWMMLTVLALGLGLAGTGRAALNQILFDAYGQFHLSVDGGGVYSTSNPTYVLQVEKPSATAVVHRAFLLAATTPQASTPTINQITLDGSSVSWSHVASSGFSGMPSDFHNMAADVTAAVGPMINAAAPGLLSLTLSEGTQFGMIDGTVLAVVFEDPAQSVSRHVSLLFGAQAVAGDNFSLFLGTPIDPADPAAVLDLGVAISFSNQQNPAVSMQSSLIEINGQRLTSSAGGADDALPWDGSMLTVGGIGDSNTNPADPFAPPTSHTSDDELYSLLPLISSGTQNISVFTHNPSQDDNIFFAHLVASEPLDVGIGLSLSQTVNQHVVGQTHTVTALLVDGGNLPLVNQMVVLAVVNGPNLGQTQTVMTDANGEAVFSYVGSGGVGTDTIVATHDNGTQTLMSNSVSVLWSDAPVPPASSPVLVPGLSGTGLFMLSVLLVLIPLLRLRRGSGGG